MNKILYIKDNSLFLFDNGKIKLIYSDLMSLKYNKNFLIFVSKDKNINNLYIFDAIKNNFKTITVDNIHNYSFAINLKGKVTLEDGKNLYLLNNKLEKIYESTSYKIYIENIDWLTDDIILMHIDGYYFHIPDKYFDTINIKTKNVENYLNDINYNYIIRDKNIYVYNDDEFNVFDIQTKENHEYTFRFISVDVSYDEKTIIYSTNNKIILLNVEDNTTKEFNISNVVKLKVSIDNKYLLIGINVNNFISVKILNITNNQISDFVENVTDFFWMI